MLKKFKPKELSYLPGKSWPFPPVEKEGQQRRKSYGYEYKGLWGPGKGILMGQGKEENQFISVNDDRINRLTSCYWFCCYGI